MTITIGETLITMPSKHLVPDQARQNVWPDVGPTVYNGQQQPTL